MKLGQYLSQGGGPSPQLARVTQAQGGRLVAKGQDTADSPPQFAPYGIASLAPEGERVLLLPFEDGYACVGVLTGSGGLEAGELVLKSAGGAYIRLKNNGEVEINGLTVTGDGVLRPPREE